MAARQPAPQSPSTAPLAAAFVTLLAILACFFGYPGLAALPLALVAAGFFAAPTTLTGKKDANGIPTAASAGETAAMNRYRMWQELKLRALFPTGDWLPGWPVRLWWVVFLLLAVAAAAIPVTELDGWGRALNSYGVFAATTALNGALRRWTAPEDPCPGPTHEAVTALWGANRPQALGGLIGGVLVAAVLALGLPVAAHLTGTGTVIAPVPVFPVAIVIALAAGVTVVTLTVRKTALAEWVELVQTRAQWAPLWQMVKCDPAPRLLSHSNHGTIQEDLFEADPTITAAMIPSYLPKLQAASGTAVKLAVIESPATDSQGQPIPGSQHPLRFRILTVDVENVPSLDDPNIDQTLLDLLIRAGWSWLADQAGIGRWVLMGVEPIHDTTPPAPEAAAAEEPELDDEDSDEFDIDEYDLDGYDQAPEPATPTLASWATTWAMPGGPDAKYIRDGKMHASLGGLLGVEALLDHRTEVLYLGHLTDGQTRFADQRLGQQLANLRSSDEWAQRWADILKMGAIQPRAEHELYKEADVAGVTLHRQPFVVQQGLDPLEFFKLEPKIATTLVAAPFVAVTGFSPQGSERQGERHPQAFVVTWAHQPVPAGPQKLRPQRGSTGPMWLLQGRVNQAFDVARLPRPEVYQVRALTDQKSPQHIWEMRVRLHGGVTLADVRGVTRKIQETLGCHWLRVTKSDTQDGCVIVAGADPTRNDRLVFARPEKQNQEYVTSLDWEQAFADAKVTGVGASLPKLAAAEVLPRNEAVQVLDFKLPTGTDQSMVKAATPKLRAGTGNQFVEVRPSPVGADHTRLLVAKEHPLPDTAGVDWDAIGSITGNLYFATGVEGEPVGFEPKVSPHVLVAGTSGGGKSVVLQLLMYAAAVDGAELYLIDPTKAGADFQFAAPYARAFASQVDEAAAVMKAVYQEVARRRTLNAEHGVGSYRDLPEAVRPTHIYLFMDEFTSLMQADPVSKTASDDPEVEYEREQLLAGNRQKAYIGTMAGKIAREARSAGVTLVLATQKLSAKILDDIPGANDLKALTLDTRIPVPVSDRFPTGWATNADLEVGDLVYTPKGTTTPIVGFTDVLTDRDTYAVTFDDGQVVETDGGHLWQAADYDKRNRPAPMRPGRFQEAKRLLASSPGWMSPSELAEAIGYLSTETIVRLAGQFGTPRGLFDRASGEVTAYRRQRGAAPRLFHALTAQSLFAGAANRFAAGITTASFVDNQWLTARELAEIAVDGPVDASTAGAMGTALNAAGCPTMDGQRAPYVYDAEHFLTRFIDATGDASDGERLVTTEQMAASLTHRGQRANWAVRVAAPIDAEAVELPVDPYVLGAWLGDGSRGSGIITSSAADSCTDEYGLTDQQHMVSELEVAGFQPKVLDCATNLIGTRGLRVPLREIGVLNDKCIPATYLRASFEQRLALLQGLMDTDGSASKSGQCSISQTNEAIASDILELVRSLGIKATTSTWPAGYGSGDQRKITGTVHHVQFRTDLPVFRLPRKLARLGTLRDGSRSRWRYVRSIEKVTRKPMRCIGVDDPGHLFLVEGFIPTHNTNLARILMGNATMGERMSALKNPMEAPELGDVIPKGRGLWESAEANPRLIQVWFEGSQDVFAAHLAQWREPVERVDLAPFMDRQVERPGDRVETGPAPRPGSPVSAEPEVVDLGEFEFELDDLDLDDEPELPETGGDDGAELVTLTFGGDADTLTIDDAPSDAESEFGWGLLDAVLLALDEAGPVGELVWARPDWDDADDIGVTRADLVREAFELIDVPVRLVTAEAADVVSEVAEAETETATETAAELEAAPAPATATDTAPEPAAATPAPETATKTTAKRPSKPRPKRSVPVTTEVSADTFDEPEPANLFADMFPNSGGNAADSGLDDLF